MIALVVLGVGLLGLGALVGGAVKVNHSAYLRTQAGFLARGMADRMRSNLMATWAGDYDGTYTTGGTPPDCSGADCSGTNIAVWDTSRWGGLVEQDLPNGSGNIACAFITGFPGWGSLPLVAPPLDGTCTVSLTWDENGTEGNSNQQFDLVFTP